MAVRSFEGRGAGPRPAGPPAASASLPIWPYLGTSGGDVQAIDAIQAQVDQGHQPWYLSPRIVAEVFAMEVLEWERRDIQASVRSDDPVQVAIANPSLSGPIAEVRTMLTMERWRGRADGIFVITRADAEILDLRFPVAGQNILDAEELTFAGSLQGISQRLLALRLTMNIEGGFSFGSSEELPSEVEITEGRPSNLPSPEGSLEEIAELIDESVVPGPDGEFETTIPMPDQVPAAPGVSVFVHDATGNKIAVEAFRLGEVAPISLSPIPGPTPTSDDATPAPILMLMRDRTGDRETLGYADAWIEAMGRGRHHGGYEPGFKDPAVALDGDSIATTIIHFSPGYQGEAERVERILFPGAQIVPSADLTAPLDVELGQDFTNTHAERMAAYGFVEHFGLARQEGAGAERFMTEGVARYYAEDEEARLYGGYTSGHGVRVGLGDTEEEFFLHFFRQQDAWTERIRLEEVGGKLKVVDAFLSAVVEG